MKEGRGGKERGGEGGGNKDQFHVGREGEGEALSS